MKKISCRTTFYQKKLFPLVFIGFGIYAMIVGGTGESGHPFFILLFLLIITLIIFAHIQFKVFFLMDEVFDDGDSLLLRNSGKEVRIPLQEIENICYPKKNNYYSRLEQVELTLKHPTEFGTEIYFLSAGDDLFSNEANTDIPDLMERINQTKTEQNQQEQDRIID